MYWPEPTCISVYYVSIISYHLELKFKLSILGDLVVYFVKQYSPFRVSILFGIAHTPRYLSHTDFDNSYDNHIET